MKFKVFFLTITIQKN
ncbi:YrzI family small protein, partial [Bacillus cereus]|nr:YrzI family small protein [Bacillus cereus]MBL3816743.1 YrzI family small protein [Bacillus cereus]MCC2368478.1 YrzI family small protein [Bacillus cereus]MCC2488534.1 YrzI family small protein [Bacillus cereus]